MENENDSGSILLAPFRHFGDLSDRMSYLYLLSSLFAALCVYMVNKIRKGEAGTVPLLRWLLPPEVLKHPSARTDVAYFVVNKMLRAAIYSSILITAPLTSATVTVLLKHGIGPPGDGFAPNAGFSILTTIVIMLVLDFALWFLHLVFHKVPVLWDYHKVHHSAEVMTPITAARMHPVEEILDSLLSGIVVGATYAVMKYLLGPAAFMITIFEINVVLALFYFSAFHLRHSHVWLRYPVWLQHIFVCPAQHQVHHSIDRKHWDKNMGFIFAFWDWAFGTLYAPKGKEEITFGLGTEEDGGTWHSLRALYFLPFRQTFERFRQRKAAVFRWPRR